MWRKLSLRMRLSGLFGLLLALGLSIDVGGMLLGADDRIEAEVDSSMRLSTEVVSTGLAGLHDSADAGPGVDRLVASLQNLRHVRVFRQALPEGAPPIMLPREEGGSVPQWFADLIRPKTIVRLMPAVIGNRRYGDVVVMSYPWDEMAEVWEDVQSVTLVGAGLLVVAFGFICWVVSRFLQPIRHLGSGLARLERDDYAVNIVPAGPPELVDIGIKLNRLTETLASARAENRLLVNKLISLQDDERKEIARELHDEFGAHLFAIRANATSLVAAVRQADHDPANLRPTVKSILELADGLQRLNRRLLSRLRPTALVEHGLEEALRGLVTQWKSQHREAAVILSLPEALDGLDEPVGLTIYRIVQESLTNVSRHADASEVTVSVDYDRAPAETGGRPVVRVIVRDNGVGMPPAAKHGLGLLGMRERILALGGHMKITNAPDGGVAVEASLSLAEHVVASEAAGEARTLH